jgi:hypothetical protein
VARLDTRGTPGHAWHAWTRVARLDTRGTPVAGLDTHPLRCTRWQGWATLVAHKGCPLGLPTRVAPCGLGNPCVGCVRLWTWAYRASKAREPLSMASKPRLMKACLGHGHEGTSATGHGHSRPASTHRPGPPLGPGHEGTSSTAGVPTWHAGPAQPCGLRHQLNRPGSCGARPDRVAPSHAWGTCLRDPPLFPPPLPRFSFRGGHVTSLPAVALRPPVPLPPWLPPPWLPPAPPPPSCRARLPMPLARPPAPLPMPLARRPAPLPGPAPHTARRPPARHTRDVRPAAGPAASRTPRQVSRPGPAAGAGRTRGEERVRGQHGQRGHRGMA